MTERQWIKIHTGLTDDPKHRSRMGVRVWYFMWLSGRADWESGIVPNYTDAWAAEEMSSKEVKVSARTIEGQRQQLEKDEYIICHQGDQCQHIRIMRWRNPKQVNPPMINIPGQVDTWYALLRTPGTPPSRTPPRSKPRTPSIEEKNQITPIKTNKDKQPPAPADPRSKHPAIQAFRDVLKTYPQKSEAPAPYKGDWWDVIISTVGEGTDAVAAWANSLREWTGISGNKFNLEGQLGLYRKKTGGRKPSVEYPSNEEPGDTQRLRSIRETQAEALGVSKEDYDEWTAALQILEPSMAKEAFTNYLQTSHLIWTSGFEGLIVVQTWSAAEWINKRLMVVVQRALSYNHPDGLALKAVTYEEALKTSCREPKNGGSQAFTSG